MFNFSKQVDRTILQVADDTDHETGRTGSPDDDDILGETPELVDLPPPRALVVDGSLRFDNVNYNSMRKEDLLSTSLHTVESQPSIILPIPSFVGTRGTMEEDRNLVTDDLSFHASEVSVSELTEMALLAKTPSPQDMKNESDNEYFSTRVDHDPLNSLERPIEHYEAELEAEEPNEPLDDVTSIKIKLAFVLFALVLAAAIFSYATLGVFSLVADDDMATEHTLPTAVNHSSPLAPSHGKALGIDIADKGISVQYKQFSEAQIETYSLESWDTIGTTTLHTSWLFLLSLISIFSFQRRSSGRKDDKDVVIKSEKAVKTEKAIEDFDLSAYKSFKVVELREILRKRGCKTSGKKSVLVERLATVYRAELSTLPVAQLHKILKSKNYSQNGRKDEIIRVLVEDGL
eukprot:scaffold8505_cov130-Cylindrotheca_fusiformis.AAC.13